ncbi:MULTISPECIES: A24 family peptidase [Pseudomonas]|uniref:A24 family peptidase n=1 Tax=Pseudomonas TaxID=286 RepID=UPI001BE9BEA9|nr:MULTISPECIES: prepilin peptidase [Pseudomonas]MBT2338885.1 prepilin peptidase [Pseudomonas fluorescens]MCD4527668.1 prepilin peptidase [Pseudomonas sp. C3-2018]
MSMELLVSTLLLLGLLGVAVVSDLLRHRIPNLLVLLGLALGLASQVYSGGISGLGDSLLGVLICFALFLPMYVTGGMAAGDVKLMTMVGSFLPFHYALWAALFSLIAGGACGFLVVLARGQLLRTLGRYWLIVRAQAYLAPEPDEVAGKPFPYSIAILVGTLNSVYWQLIAGGWGG